MHDDRFFCAIAWTHLHGQANGDILPCCIADPRQPFGSFHQNSLSEVWTGDAMRTLRQNMLDGKPSATCRYCYDVEAAGGVSQRQNFNRIFSDKISSMRAAGAEPPFELSFIDFRFSNLCNFKCRSCGPQASSAWVDDWKMLYPNSPVQTIRSLPDGQKWSEILTPHLHTMEEIYFAGGEPLFMEEHYWLLRELIALGRAKKIRLRYNTNFTYLKSAHGDAIELWKEFDDVFVGASLDAAGPRGEYLRKGLRWQQFLANRERLRVEAPHVSFKITSVMGLMNAFAVTDMHREIVEANVIQADELLLHILNEPSFLSTQVLPALWKDRVEVHVQQHLDWLTKQSGDMSAVVNNYRMLLNHMRNGDQSHLLPQFTEWTKRLDSIRGESFANTFPEFQGLLT